MGLDALLSRVPVETAHYGTELTARIDRVFRAHPELADHRTDHPWLTGWLGDPDANVWFLSEAASQWRVEAVDRDHSRGFTPEDQWAVSPGDKRFREALYKAGFKGGGPLTSGGWQCYVGVLSKSHVDYATWRKLPDSTKFGLFETWAPGLRWELEQGQPKVVAAMGSVTERAIVHLVKSGAIPPPRKLTRIWSYGYLMQPGPGSTPPMDPRKIATYEAQFVALGHDSR